MDKFTLTREEMLEIAEIVTFGLDDRLVPFSRKELRANAWLEGYNFAKRHEKTSDEENPKAVEEDTPPVAPPVAIIKNAIREYLSHWLVCTRGAGMFRKGEHYWLELLENGSFCGRSDNIKEKIIDLSLRELFNNFEITMENI